MDAEQRSVFQGIVYYYRENMVNCRYQVTLKDAVDGALLQQALDAARAKAPYYFQKPVWEKKLLHLEPSDAPCPVRQGSAKPEFPDETGFTVALSYEGKVVYFDWFHFMADGRGIAPFMTMVLQFYCNLRYGTAFEGRALVTDPPYDIEDILAKYPESQVANDMQRPVVQTFEETPTCCRVRLENQLNGEAQTVELACGIWPKRAQTVRTAFGSPFCGRIRLSVVSVRLYDCFGLIGVKAKTDAHTASVVQPDTFPQSLILTPSSARVEEAEDYSTERPGSDLSEIFQIRDYVPGDSPRQVHWKLSQKYGKLIVKDASLPITRSAALFWERTEEAPTRARTDAEAEIVVSLCRNLLAQSVQFTLCWNENGRLVRFCRAC